MLKNNLLFSTLFFGLLFFNFHAHYLPVELELNPHIAEYATSYKQQAKKWVEAYLIAPDKTVLVCEHDIQLINNLLYFSYARSFSTVVAQERALALVPTLWQAWYNIAHTRRNPARGPAYEITARPNLNSDLFFDAAEQHAHIGKIYATITQDMVNGHALSTTRALRAVETIRSQARLVISSALLDISEYTEQLYQLIDHDPLEKKMVSKKNRLHSFLMTTIPHYAQGSFTTVDKLCEKTTQTLGDALNTITHLSSYIWNKLEQARAGFYLAHYRALNKKLMLLENSDTYRRILYDEHGVIEMH